MLLIIKFILWENGLVANYTIKSCGKAHSHCKICRPDMMVKYLYASKMAAEINIGKKHTPETLQKMRNYWSIEENRQKACELTLGFRHDEDTLRRMREYQSNRPQSHLDAISKGQIGKKRSAEMRRSMSISAGGTGISGDITIRKQYGITLEEYQNMIKKQNNVCKICGGKSKTGKRLTIDHDHQTGKVRGLLCFNCNTGLGHFKDDYSLLLLAAKYLKHNEYLIYMGKDYATDSKA